MTVTPEMERAGLEALLKLAEELGDPVEQLSLLHRLVEVELGISERDRAQSWLDQAQRVLDSAADADQGEVARYQSEQRQLRERVAKAPASPPPRAPTPVVKKPDLIERWQEFERAQAQAQRGQPPALPEPTLTLSLAPAAIPDGYAFARDDGPACPKNAHFIPFIEYERVAGFGYWSIFVVLALLTLMCSVMLITNLVSGNHVNAVASVFMAALFGFLATLTSYRLRAGRDDARARRDGTYRLGWYFTRDALLLRTSNSFNVFPRDRVVAARTDSRRSSDTNSTHWWLVLTYRDDTDAAVEMPLDFGYTESRRSIATLIEEWRKHGRI